MKLFSKIAAFLYVVSSRLMGGIVVVTSLPDETHPLDPLTTVNGLLLTNGVGVSVGAFPGMSDVDVLNAASTGGFEQVTTAFVQFGTSCSIGEGVDQAEGNFEIAVQEVTLDLASPWIGEEVSILIKKDEGQEFLVARFKGRLFEADSDTGINPVLSLHMADAKVIVGNLYGTTKFSTSPAPETGSFSEWIKRFTDITEPSMRLADADPDRDGRTNFLEYATGGNPTSPTALLPCQILKDQTGYFWICFARAPGIGMIRHTLESSSDLGSPWQTLDGVIESDPNPPVGGSLNWMRMRVPQPMVTKGFFRLKSESLDPL